MPRWFTGPRRLRHRHPLRGANRPSVSRRRWRRPRPQEAQQIQQRIFRLGAKVLPQRPRQRRRVRRRHERPPRRAPRRTPGEVLQPPTPPTFQRASVYAQLFLQHPHALRRRTMPQRRHEYHDETGVDPAPEVPHRFGRQPAPAALRGAAKAVAPSLDVHAPHLAGIIRPVQCARAMGTTQRAGLRCQIRIDLSQHRPQRRARTFV